MSRQGKTNLTADRLDFEKMKTVYFLNKFEHKIEDFDRFKELRVKSGDVKRKDGKEFDPFSKSLLTTEFYGSLSAAQDALKVHLECSIKHYTEQIEWHHKLKADAERILENLKQDTAAYLKPSSDKKPEKIGNIRI